MSSHRKILQVASLHGLNGGRWEDVTVYLIWRNWALIVATNGCCCVMGQRIRDSGLTGVS